MQGYEAFSIGLYILLMLVIGIYSYRKSTNNTEEFLLGGRKLGPAVTALSAGAADMSGWLLMGLPGAIYISGLASTWIVIGVTIGAYLNYILVAPRLRIYTEVAQNAITLPVFFENRYKNKNHLLKITSSLFILIFFTLYTSAGMVAGGKLFQSAFGMEYSLGLWVTGLVVVFYTFLGGFLAVSLTDFVQGTIMVVALIIVPIVALTQIGGVSTALSIISEKDISYLNMLEGMSPIAIFSLLAWGLGYFGQPHIITRFMAIDHPKDLVKARRIGMTWMIFTVLGAVAVGLIGIAYLKKFDATTMAAFDASKAEAETLFIYFSRALFHPLVAGFLLSAILAAVMSTISSQLLVTSSSLTEDIYKAFLNKKAPPKHLLLVSRISVLVVATVAIVLAITPKGTILNLVGNAWAGFGAAFGPMILVSLLMRKSTWQGALSGMLVGGITVICWIYFDHPFKAMYEIIPGFTLALITNILVSKLSYQSNVEIESEFQRVEKLLK